MARAGLTEHQAASTAGGARVAYLPLAELDRAVTAGRTDGYIKFDVPVDLPLEAVTGVGGRLDCH